MALDELRIARLERSRPDDFWALHSAPNAAEWCACVAWWVPDWAGFGARSAEQNRGLREGLFARGELDGYLAYEGQRPVGWCQVGWRDRLLKLVREQRRPPDPERVAISCLLVAPDRRRRGVARFLLQELLRDLRARGTRHVEAYPKRESCPETAAEELWTGPMKLFLDAGFRLAPPASPVAEEPPKRVTLELDLAAASGLRG